MSIFHLETDKKKGIGVNREIIMEKYSKARLEKALNYWEQQLQIINEYKLNKDNCWHYQFQGPLSKTDVKFFKKRRHKIYKKCKAYCENKIEIIKEMKGKKQ